MLPRMNTETVHYIWGQLFGGGNGSVSTAGGREATLTATDQVQRFVCPCCGCCQRWPPDAAMCFCAPRQEQRACPGLLAAGEGTLCDWCSCFLTPSSNLCQRSLRRWRGTLRVPAAAHQRYQRPPKGLGANKTVEAPEHQSTRVNMRRIHPGWQKKKKSSILIQRILVSLCWHQRRGWL